MRLFFALVLLISGFAPALAAGARASAWAEFREVRVRLLLLEPIAGDTLIRGGIGIRLQPDYKTYWRSPGDSGVPPVVDVSGSEGVSGFELAFPFPTRFDDGAGGHSWGYKRDIILPFTAKREGNGPVRLVMKLDFAVCGTMCIPLAAELKLDPGQTQPDEIAVALKRAHERLPKVLNPAEIGQRVAARRIPSNEKQGFELEIRHESASAEFALFAEAKGYFHVADAVQKAPGTYLVKLMGRPSPGGGGKFGPVRLTFGTSQNAYEGIIDLDGLPPAP
ncbi:MAG: protein-disulfide reductase DsbD domain-containing protein [Rhabdaerophilum sp.]